MTDLVSTLNAFVAEAREMRAGLPPMPGAQAAPYEVHEYLLDVRRRIDRVEFLLTQALRIRSATRQAATQTAREAEDAWDDAILRVRSSPVRRGDEYTSAKERAAAANLATVDARRDARGRADDHAFVEEHVEILRLAHRGLDGVRHDTLTVLRLVQFESHLER